MTSLFIIAIIILIIYLLPSNKVNARVQVAPFNQIKIVKIDTGHKEGDTIHDGPRFYTVLEIFPNKSWKHKFRSLEKTKEKKQWQQKPEKIELMSSSTKERILITGAVIGLTLCTLVAINMYMAAIANKKSIMLKIPVSSLVVSVVFILYMILLLGMGMIIKKQIGKHIMPPKE